MNSPNKEISSEKAIEVKNLTVSFNGEEILRNLSFDIEKGTVTAIIGPNGAGKTTLLKTLLGLIPKKSGEIKIYGKDYPLSCRHLHGHQKDYLIVGYVPQHFSFDKTIPITIYEFLRLSLLPEQKEEKILSSLKEIGLESKAFKPLGELSGGEFQRVLIARAILNDPKILFLDEPVSGVDIRGEKTFYELVRTLNKKHNLTCLLVSHEIDIVYRYADYVLCLNRDFLCAGVPEKVLTPETLNRLYGEEISLYKHPHK